MTALLQPEIFVQTFKHLLQPLPEPHSTANTSKSSIRQKSLITCLLVSKQFYNLAAPVLYHTIVTDDLPLLFRTLRPIDGIISKKELLGLTKHLYIEYAEDSSVHIRRIPPSGSDNPRTIIAEEFSRRSFIAIQLAEDLFISWRSIFNHHDRRKPLFSSLETLSTGAFFGHQKEIYWYSAEYSPRWVDLLEMARWGLYTMLRDTPSIRHFCGAGWGPLALGDLSRPFKGGENVPVIARHLIELPIEDPYIVKLHDIYACTGTADSRKILRIPIGVQNVWYAHIPAEEAIAMVRAAYQTTLGLRDKLGKDPNGVNDEERNWAHGASNSEVRRVYSERYPATKADWDMKGQLYLHFGAKGQLGSARSEQEEEESRHKAEDKEQQMSVELALGERELVGGMKVQDRLNVRSILDAQCEACSWSPDKGRRVGSAAVPATASEPDTEPESMSTPNTDLGLETESELELESDPESELEMKSVSDLHERDRLISLPAASAHAVPDYPISFVGGTRRFLWVVGVVIVGSIIWNRFG